MARPNQEIEMKPNPVAPTAEAATPHPVGSRLFTNELPNNKANQHYDTKSNQWRLPSEFAADTWRYFVDVSAQVRIRHTTPSPAQAQATSENQEQATPGAVRSNFNKAIKFIKKRKEKMDPLELEKLFTLFVTLNLLAFANVITSLEDDSCHNSNFVNYSNVVFWGAIGLILWRSLPQLKNSLPTLLMSKEAIVREELNKPMVKALEDGEEKERVDDDGVYHSTAVSQHIAGIYKNPGHDRILATNRAINLSRQLPARIDSLIQSICNTFTPIFILYAATAGPLYDNDTVLDTAPIGNEPGMHTATAFLLAALALQAFRAFSAWYFGTTAATEEYKVTTGFDIHHPAHQIESHSQRNLGIAYSIIGLIGGITGVYGFFKSDIAMAIGVALVLIPTNRLANFFINRNDAIKQSARFDKAVQVQYYAGVENKLSPEEIAERAQAKTDFISTASLSNTEENNTLALQTAFILIGLGLLAWNEKGINFAYAATGIAALTKLFVIRHKQTTGYVDCAVEAIKQRRFFAPPVAPQIQDDSTDNQDVVVAVSASAQATAAITVTADQSTVVEANAAASASTAIQPTRV